MLQDLKGGGVWQDLASAWKLASAYHLENHYPEFLGIAVLCLLTILEVASWAHVFIAHSLLNINLHD